MCGRAAITLGIRPHSSLSSCFAGSAPPPYEQFLKMSVILGLLSVFVHRLFTFSILCFFWFSLDCLVLFVLFVLLC